MNAIENKADALDIALVFPDLPESVRMRLAYLVEGAQLILRAQEETERKAG